jgi:hypothetical protein
VTRILTPLAVIGAMITAPISHSSGVGPRAANADSGSATTPAFTKSEAIARTNLVADGNALTNDANGNPLPAGTTCQVAAGCKEQVEQRTISLSVDVTSGLQTFQQLTVTWTGAHPTNFITPDPTTEVAGSTEEYPMVLLECRGVDDPSQPAADQISPETCWTEYDSERYNYSLSTQFPSWRLDANASSAELAQFVNVPNPLPTACTNAGASSWTAAYVNPLLSTDGTIYNQYPCGGMRAPEQLPAAGTNTQGVPDNTTFGVTGADGTGTGKFVVWTDETNATLGCSSTVACSLVAIPIIGTSCNETVAGASAADIATCEYSDSQSGAVGDSSGNRAKSFAVEGDSWWTASSWADRISVPLNFAPPGNFCSVVSSKTPVLVYGSELMTEVNQQWSPSFCNDPTKAPFSFVPESEAAAVNTLSTGTTEAAFDTYPPAADGLPGASTGTSPPVVNAPVAVGGFAIATLVDDKNGYEVTDIRLDARLLAKLLSESYPALTQVAQGDGGTWQTQTDPTTGKPVQVLTSPGPMANNPLLITDDPEFQALNPTIPTTGGYSYDNAAELIALSSNSDVMRALTSYINADPAARAFLDGTPDPWGMVVNPAYKGISLPTDFWPLNDSFVDTSLQISDPCWSSSAVQVPYLTQVSEPAIYLRDVTQFMEFGLPNSMTTCQPPQTSNGVSQLTTGNRESPGQRFMLGVVSLSEAHLYGLDTAALETQSTVAPGQVFTTSDASDPTKFSFASPTANSIQAAADTLAADPTTGTWTLDYSQLRSNAANAAAYPGTMLVSMSVPTYGLSPSDAAAYSSLLTFAAGPGQTEGTDFGQLPAGYLPLTAADGLGQLVGYTTRAAAAVTDQTCELPDLTDSNETISTYSQCPVASPSPSPSPSASASASPSPTPIASVIGSPTPSVSATTPVSSPAVEPTVSQNVGPTTTPPAVGVAQTETAPHTTAATSSAPPSPTPAEDAAASASSTPPSSAAPTIELAAGTTPKSPVGPVGSLVPLLLLVGALGGTASLVINTIGDGRARRRVLSTR